jgi:hypothetical protein
LANLDSPPRDRLDEPLLTRLSKETDSGVRARLITGLTARAAAGAAGPLRAVLAGLDDQIIDVRFRSVVAMQMTRHPEGLEKVLREIASDQPFMRLAAIRALGAYDIEAILPHRLLLEARLALESDARVKGELDRLLRLLPVR